MSYRHDTNTERPQQDTSALLIRSRRGEPPRIFVYCSDAHEEAELKPAIARVAHVLGLLPTVPRQHERTPGFAPWRASR